MNEYISNESMAAYLALAYNSDIFIKIVSSAESENKASLYFQKLGNALAKYYISTGDNTIEGINAVCKLFIESYLNDTFDDKFMDFIILKCAKQIGLEKEPTIGEKLSIVNIVESRNFNNSFYTHCFPGSLYRTISQNGLDVSCELFHEELALLEKYFKTGFKTNKLCYCELSEASLSYATRNIPERVNFALGSNIIFDQGSKYESYLHSFKNNLIQLVQAGGVDESEFDAVYSAGKRIIDFYCTNEQSAIALFIHREREKQSHSTYVPSVALISSKISNTFLAKKLQEILTACQNDPENIVRILDSGIKEIEAISPEFKSVAEEMINNELMYQMKNIAVSNYMHGGNADGYEIESGRMSPETFTIALCPCPIDLWCKNHEKAEVILQSNVPAESSEVRLQNAYRKILLVDRILTQASTEETRPETIEYITFGNSQIPVYVSGSNLSFPTNYLVGLQGGTYFISLFTVRALTNRCVNELQEQIQNNKSMRDTAISKYKLSDIYSSADDEDLEYYATQWFAKELFNSCDEEEQKRRIRDIALKGKVIGIKKVEREYIIISNGETSVVSSEVLVDLKSQAPYNNLYACMVDAARNKMI